MLKIASIVPYQILPPEQGGQKAIYYFMKSLTKYAEVTCFTVKENSTWSTPNLQVVPLLGSTKNKFRYINPFLFLKIKNHCRKQGIDLLLMEHPYYGWLGYTLNKFAGISYVIHSYNIESIRFKTIGKKWWKFLYAYEKFAHTHARANFFITEEDKLFAIRHFSLEENRCFVATYGIEAQAITETDKKKAHEAVCDSHGLDHDTLLLLFNGSLDYTPNLNAVKKIITHINPLLKENLKKAYKIIICGKASEEVARFLKDEEKNGILYTGFVPDIQTYFRGADIFLNPVTEGGGIKTKLVEALAAGTSSVSFKNGAIGIPTSITGDSLKITDDDDYTGFVQAVTETAETTGIRTPPAFYDYFNQDNIARRTAETLSAISG